MNKIVLFNPKKELQLIEAFESKLLNTLRSGNYINNKECARFETLVSAYLENRHCITTSSGTSALELILKAAIKKKTKILVTANTFVAVVEAILNNGHIPEFVDIDEDSWQMPKITAPESVAIVSHLYGSVSPAIESDFKFTLEDASQSFGASFKEKKIGSFGHASAISLYPTKNLGALGDAGIMTTDIPDLAMKIRALRNHGQTSHQNHQYIGTTARMDEIQATLLIEKMNFFEKFLYSRRQIAHLYKNRLKDLPLDMPMDIDYSLPAPNLFVIKTDNRDALKAYLQKNGIDCGIHYPVPIHKMPAFKSFKWAKVHLPNTEQLLSQILTIPLWVGMTIEQTERVVEKITSFFKN